MSFVAASALPDPESARQRGRAAREKVARSKLATLSPRDATTDAVGLLQMSCEGRLSDLVPLRFGRMLASPFSFFRGAALLQAHDLARDNATDIEVQLCGDAHLSNFGRFTSAEGLDVFDVDDFDETSTGPFEWDLKRLATSAVVAASEIGLNERQQDAIALAAPLAYRTSMREFASEPTMSIWHTKLDVHAVMSDLDGFLINESGSRISDVVTDAKGTRDVRAVNHVVDASGQVPRIVSDPPLLVPLELLVSADQRGRVGATLRDAVRDYAATLSSDRQTLLAQFTPVDVARKVVGVGSVGLRCYAVLLLGRDPKDLFFLQVKEATSSVLDSARGLTNPHSPGERVVRGQKQMQATSDLLLGWCEIADFDGTSRSYYVRQLFDNKATVDVTKLNAASLTAYVKVCAWVLARAHARSGRALAINGYVGVSTKFDEAIAAYATAYAQRNLEDFNALARASKVGTLTAAHNEVSRASFGSTTGPVGKRQ